MFAKDLMSKYYALSAELGVRDDDDDDDDMTIMITNMYWEFMMFQELYYAFYMVLLIFLFYRCGNWSTDN